MDLGLAGKVVVITGEASGLGGAMAEGFAGEGAVTMIDGVNVNAIGPGFVRTPLTEALISSPGVEEKMVARIPLGRVGRPEDVVGTVLFLASRQADYITGQLGLIDGGRTVD